MKGKMRKHTGVGLSLVVSRESSPSHKQEYTKGPSGIGDLGK